MDKAFWEAEQERKMLHPSPTTPSTSTSKSSLVAPLEMSLAEWRTLVADCKVVLRMLSWEDSLEVGLKRPCEGKETDL
jgi:hypothetical protein